MFLTAGEKTHLTRTEDPSRPRERMQTRQKNPPQAGRSPDPSEVSEVRARTAAPPCFPCVEDLTDSTSKGSSHTRTKTLEKKSFVVRVWTGRRQGGYRREGAVSVGGRDPGAARMHGVVFTGNKEPTLMNADAAQHSWVEQVSHVGCSPLTSFTWPGLLSVLH